MQSTTERCASCWVPRGECDSRNAPCSVTCYSSTIRSTHTTQLAAPMRELPIFGALIYATRTSLCCQTLTLSSSRHMAQAMLPRLRTQSEMSAFTDTPGHGLVLRCGGARPRSTVGLIARPSRSVQVSSGRGTSYNEQTAASYVQIERFSSESSPRVVQGKFGHSLHASDIFEATT